jgi:hypothetical protein
MEPRPARGLSDRPDNGGTRLRIWGSAVRIRSGAPYSETSRAIRTAIARRKVAMGDWAGTQADGSVVEQLTTNLGVRSSNLFGRTIHVDLVDPDIDVRSEGSPRLMRP